jgi:hypothetical protein
VREGREGRETGEAGEDEFEKSGTASCNWVALFGLLIVIAGVISLLDSWYRVWWASWDQFWLLLVIAFGARALSISNNAPEHTFKVLCCAR